MDLLGLDVLQVVYSNIDVFLLIMIRIFGFLIILPVFAGNSIPNTAKIGLAALISFLLLTTGKIPAITYENSIMGFVLLVTKEFLVGFIMGFVVFSIFSMMYFIGQLMDMQIGFSMVSVLDPLTQLQVPIVGNMLYFIVSVFFVRMGGLNAFIQAVFYSFDVLPIGKAIIIDNQAIFQVFLHIMIDYISVGVQFALPVVGTILILDIALGILVKAVPQMNVFVVGVPIKIFLGLFVLYSIVPIFYTMYDYVFNNSYTWVMTVLKGMIP